MTHIEELRREADIIQSYLEVNIGGCDANELILRLDQLGVYYARSGAMHAEVVGLIDSATARFMADNTATITSLSPSLVKTLIKGATSELNALERKIERINATCSKQCDNLRTLISYEKQRAQLL
jgi:hypothetical protein